MRFVRKVFDSLIYKSSWIGKETVIIDNQCGFVLSHNSNKKPKLVIEERCYHGNGADGGIEYETMKGFFPDSDLYNQWGLPSADIVKSLAIELKILDRAEKIWNTFPTGLIWLNDGSVYNIYTEEIIKNPQEIKTLVMGVAFTEL